jgi:hypothetical protein
VFCAGDGSGTPCPCGNASAVGAGAGCLNSLGNAGTLRGSGVTQIAGESFHLAGSGMPNTGALYFQGTTQVSGGAGSVFGDGLRCAGGAIHRLGIKQNVLGISGYPEAGDPSISMKRHHPRPLRQAWYRNSALGFYPELFNLTNGCCVIWTP